MNKKSISIYEIISALLLLGLGIVFLFAPAQKIIEVIYILLGVSIILTGCFKLLVASFMHEVDSLIVTEGIIDLVIGILIMIFHNAALTITLAIIFLVVPIIKIILSANKKETFLKQLPLLVIGIMIGFSGDLFAKVFIKIVGVCLVLLAVFLFTKLHIDRKEINHIDSKAQKDIIDATCEVKERDE